MRAATLALGWIRAVHQVLPREYESQADPTLGRVRERKTAYRTMGRHIYREEGKRVEMGFVFEIQERKKGRHRRHGL
jgi:hypothetical protein